MDMIDRIFLYLFKRDFSWFWWLLRVMVSLVAPFGSQGRATILIYHHIFERFDSEHRDGTDREQFAWQMKLIRRVFQPITIGELAATAKSGEIPARAVVVTFDDGYLDNYTQALPILKENGVPATIYVAVEAIESGYMWNEAVTRQILKTQSNELDLSRYNLGVYSTMTREEREAAVVNVVEKMKPLNPRTQKEIVAYVNEAYGEVDLPRQMLTGEHLRSLAQEASITLGCHTQTHPMLSQIGIKDAEKDICKSRALLETYLLGPVEHFAYPYGKYGEHFHAEHVNLIARLGFRTAVTTDWGTADSTSSRYMLKRFTPWDDSPIRFYLRLCANLNRA
jgi:peptidoglycan/xylan/chitin deacetylase (PgdA/CDA1 family)